eukprot:CAMPEP_0172562262 /NCGR_PEP_ID=MMETSP1067-20121228/96268_1 /TAXON_ID=265564 ORGANISM="Thalassiosira punctigera, Strain Tpunct2005C2" /NCGR_SAMPLE_ID=MMETSP1067 /ASSEMBLY_ACC=CAM_ASM_000444 /LENGTH=78 /DNA_ID=CAMNT_0013352461 /DNA_START=775 /DNA_END=1011 /DNA_ORIENTATION=-
MMEAFEEGCVYLIIDMGIWKEIYSDPSRAAPKDGCSGPLKAATRALELDTLKLLEIVLEEVLEVVVLEAVLQLMLEVV